MVRFQPAPRWYRSYVKFAHWACFALIIAAMAVGNSSMVKFGLGTIGTLWLVGFAVFGVLARPGPALTGALRAGFVPMHVGMMLLVLATAIVLLRADAGPLGGVVRTLCLATVGAGALHGCFHLWRHTALGDGALRNILPSFMHQIL